MRICLIAAVSDNGFIGKDGDLPWHVKGDLKFFMNQTLGKPIIMGRKSFESLGKPLPGRTNIVLTRNADFNAEGVLVYTDFDQALEKAREIAANDGVDEIMIGGGSGVYAMSLPYADRLYLTEIHCEVEGGDTRFPEFDRHEWQETAREPHEQGPEDDAAYTIVTWDKIR